MQENFDDGEHSIQVRGCGNSTLAKSGQEQVTYWVHNAIFGFQKIPMNANLTPKLSCDVYACTRVLIIYKTGFYRTHVTVYS